MADELIFSGYPVFKAAPAAPGADLDVQAKEVQALFDEWADRVEVRGSYSTAGFRADADLMFWWVARTADDIQDLTVAFRHTELGRRLDQREQFLGLVRPGRVHRRPPAGVRARQGTQEVPLLVSLRAHRGVVPDRPEGAGADAPGPRRARGGSSPTSGRTRPAPSAWVTGSGSWPSKRTLRTDWST